MKVNVNVFAVFIGVEHSIEVYGNARLQVNVVLGDVRWKWCWYRHSRICCTSEIIEVVRLAIARIANVGAIGNDLCVVVQCQTCFDQVFVECWIVSGKVLGHCPGEP